MHSTFALISPFQKPVSRPMPVFSGALQANSLKDNQDSFTKTTSVLFGKGESAEYFDPLDPDSPEPDEVSIKTEVNVDGKLEKPL